MYRHAERARPTPLSHSRPPFVLGLGGKLHHKVVVVADVNPIRLVGCLVPIAACSPFSTAASNFEEMVPSL